MSSSNPAGARAGTQPVAGGEPRAPRSARHMFASTVLSLEAFVVFFAALAVYGLRAVEGPVILAVGLGGAIACIVAAGLLRSVVGYVLGSLIQVGLIVIGLLVPEIRVHMLVVAVTFAIIWVVCLRVGARIDRERAERHVLEIEHWRSTGGGQGSAAERG